MFRGHLLKIVAFLLHRQKLVIIALLGLLGFLLVGITNLKITESILGALPDSEDFQEVTTLIENKQLSNQIFISLETKEPLPSEELVSLTSLFVDSLHNRTKEYVQSIDYVKENAQEVVYEHLYSHFPALIDSTYYEYIAQKIQPDSIQEALTSVKGQLLSPSGTFIQEFLISDPLFITSRFFQELGAQQGKSNFHLEEGLLVSNDGKTVMIVAVPSFDSGNSGKSSELVAILESFKESWKASYPTTNFTYFGNFEIGARNAAQVKKDTFYTMLFAITAIIAILLLYYRKWLIPVYILLPTLFGGLFSLGIIGWTRDNISGISLATGSVLIGITLDYALHFFTHLKHSRSIRETIADIAFPMLTGSFTTIAAFVALLFANSPVLRDFGLVACLALFGAGFFTVFILPVMITATKFDFEKGFGKDIQFSFYSRKEQWIHRFRFPLTFLAIALTYFFLHHSENVQFEDNLNKLSLYTEDIAEKELLFTQLNSAEEKRIYLFATGSSFDAAKQANFAAYQELNKQYHATKISQFTSTAPYLIPSTILKEKTQEWNHFWQTNQRSSTTLSLLNQAATTQGFELSSFDRFRTFIQSPTLPTEEVDEQGLLASIGLHNLVDSTNQQYTIVSTLTVPNKYLDEVKTTFSNLEGVRIFDRGAIANAMISNVKEDFNYLLGITAGLVFLSLLIIYGRIELTLLSFMPMAISWIWILGLSALLDIRFNFVNVVVSTFIFGLGDDYSIFTTDGLLNRYKTGKSSLTSYTSAIIISALTTIIGTGTLFFAVHPAIHSIAAISVIGISCIVLFSVVFQPLFFKLFVQNRVDRGVAPFTFSSLFFSLLSFFLYGVSSLLTTLALPFIILLPISRLKKRDIINKILSFFARVIIYSGPHVRKRFDGLEHLDVHQPAIYIANHSSSLDNLLVILKHPKLVMMVKGWVYKSPFFGLAVRYAGYLHTGDEAEVNIEKMKKLAAEGYSVLFFPEGTRSLDGRLNRFHKGAFYLAEQLQMDIQPIILNGASFVMPKGVHNIRKGALNIKYLPRIKATDTTWGTTYQQRTKSITKWYKEEFERYRVACEDTWLLKQRIMTNYLYKGPVLEWYFKTKWEMEKEHYVFYNTTIGDRKTILDIGCGYGYLSFFLHYKNPDRVIKGIDYDQEKIEIAANCYDKTNQLTFEQQELSNYYPKHFDVAFFNDVLHYLTLEEQEKVVRRFCQQLNEGGQIFIRDGITDSPQHAATLSTEKWSTQLLGFNKAEQPLHFFSSSFIHQIAASENLSCQMISHSEHTSNVLFILQKP